MAQMQTLARHAPAIELGRPMMTADDILSQLRELEARGAPLSVRLGNEQEFFNSRILRMDPSHGWLFLEELVPYQGHLRVAPRQPMHVYAIIGEMGAHFCSKVLHTGEHDGVAFYVLGLPEHMDSEQKRTHFRTPVEQALDTPLTLTNREGRQFTGRLVDVSLGGLRAYFDLDTPIGARELLNVKGLTLPGIPPIDCGLQVRFAREDKGKGLRLVGGRFFDLNPEDEQHLLRTLLLLEREQTHHGGRRD
ncbi:MULTISPECIES: flagellar brake protein [unclassified Ectothiorhodospira]|uniref:flagellar brake protein n=1 Tax=unclassified Ectothiorhodospira TaxID=2684909 RepID=UPI001EE8383E|nr:MULTISPECIES: flagellar brake protein [unclassified Ectothiorhodospira]MCG5516044.1 flagellar brake protein [Ectothiorhodospira sp. 9100]MCG5519048.1 flagellar brake protein [Ectothiorhodospira sp. 9905]